MGIGALCIIIGDCNKKILPFISHAHTVTGTNGTNTHALTHTHTPRRRTPPVEEGGGSNVFSLVALEVFTPIVGTVIEK